MLDETKSTHIIYRDERRGMAWECYYDDPQGIQEMERILSMVAGWNHAADGISGFRNWQRLPQIHFEMFTDGGHVLSYSTPHQNWSPIAPMLR